MDCQNLGHPTPGVPGLSKNQIFLQIKVLSFCPESFSSQNIKSRVFRFELFSVHLPLCYVAFVLFLNGFPMKFWNCNLQLKSILPKVHLTTLG